MSRIFRLLKCIVTITVAAMTIGFISAFLGGTTVLAAPEFVEHYGIWIGGTEITSENANHCPNVKGGTISFDSNTGVLTLDNVTGIDGGYDYGNHLVKIFSNNPYPYGVLSINLVGDNSFTDLGNTDELIRTHSDDSDIYAGCFVRGSGTLITSGNVIYAQGNLTLAADINVSSSGCCFYSERNIYVKGNVTASSSDDNVFFAEGTIHVTDSGSVAANVTDLSSSSYPLKAKDIDIDDTRSITGISVNDPSVITRFPNVEIAENAGYKSIYSLDEKEFVKGVIIEEPAYRVDLSVSTLDDNGKTDPSVIGGTASVDKTSGITGDKVTVTATPNEGYEVYMIAWGNGGASTDITTSKEFTIKDFDVKVDVIFKEVASSSGSTSGTPATTTYSVGVTVSTWDKDGNAVTAVGGTASVDKTSGTTGDKVTVTATPNEGYEVYMVTWGDGGVSADITTSKEFTIEDFDVTVDVIFKEVSTSTSSSGTTTDPATSTSGGSTATMDPSAPTYTVIQGADSTVDGTKDLVVEVQRSVDDEHCLDYYDWTAIDGVKLTAEQAPASSGSTVVTIKSDYLKTLGEGQHTIVINFVDNSVSTTFTIQSAAQKGGANIPATGELQSPAMYIGMALIALACGVTGIVLVKKRKEV